jgi:drug/metabolite transporter (DMT)-like permease
MPSLSDINAGPAFALIAAALWAVSPMLMASAGRRVGSFPVVLIRGLIASLLLLAVMAVMSAVGAAPTLPNQSQFFWLAASGVIGMGVGDLLVYEAFVTLGPRRTTQMLVLAPAVTVIVAWLPLGEAMTIRTLGGIAIILCATLYAVIARRDRPAASSRGFDVIVSGGESGDVEVDVADGAVAPAATTTVLQPIGREPGYVTMSGLLFAVGGAICMGIGAVTTRCAFRESHPLDPIPATFVRVAAGSVSLWIVPLLLGRTKNILGVLRDRHVLFCIVAGTLIGPFVGMFCYVLAFKQLSAGLVSTLVATTPIFAIPITWLRYRERIGWDVCAAAVVAGLGVAMLFWNP